MTDAALVADNLRKHYGATRALDGLNLWIPKGVVAGLIGPNGAGKTTTFAVVAGNVKADSGRVDVLGQGPFDARIHAGRVGLLPQDSELSRHTSLIGLLSYYAELQGMTRTAARKEAALRLDQVMLAERQHQRPGELSHGMRRRVSIAQALLGSPELILLDEPTSGLDPALVADMKEILRGLRGTSTLIVSSHVLADLEAVCDHVVFMAAGRATKQGALDDITGTKERVRVRLRAAPPLERLRQALEGIELTADGNDLVFQAPQGLELHALNARVLRVLLDLGAEILEVRPGESLEAAYMADLGRRGGELRT